MALWYQTPPLPTLNRISPTLKLNSLRCTCSYNLSILNSRPTHILELEPEPIFASVKTFIPATVANLGHGFDFLSCAVDGLGDFISLSIDLSVHPGKISITKISGDAAGKISRDPLSNCARIAAIKVLKMLEI
ncbi:homoserine kinase-like [Quercus lobata]|uniref:homoserine kinase-like n=1 Tax=Quercus lobata TaxID=97700 RepID=UPI0012441FD7|nr:homoserine kinase-like [Quercus lobata]